MFNVTSAMLTLTPVPAVAGPAMTTTPAAWRRMRPKALAAPIPVAKKGSFDITEGP